MPPMYFIVICGGPDATLPEFAALSALVRSDDGTNWFRQKAVLASRQLEAPWRTQGEIASEQVPMLCTAESVVR
jgi:hypothetical protein